MSRSIQKVRVAIVAAILALATPAHSQEAKVTGCTALDICYRVNTKYLDAITANVSRVRQLIADSKAKGKAVGYLSVPLSPAGGGSYAINSEAAKWIAGDVETRLGQSWAWILNPGAEGSEAMMGASGADYMYMWTQILEGRSGHGEDFDFFYFAGPTDFSKYFLQPAKDGKQPSKSAPGQVEDYLGKLNDFFDKRVTSDPEFKKNGRAGTDHQARVSELLRAARVRRLQLRLARRMEYRPFAERAPPRGDRFRHHQPVVDLL